MKLNELYRPSLTLLTDLYQLTMAYGYWQVGMADHEAIFYQSFRENPFSGGYTINAGLDYVIDFIEHFQFSEDDIEYLRDVPGNDGKPIFSKDFLNYLKEMTLSVDVAAMPEGTVVFPHEPMIRVQGPLLQCQLLETPLLNLINFQSLIATKAARVSQAAQGDPVLEFGLRRAQGIDGGLAASRAAYIGGCAATSNVLAGKHFGIPIKGTHAHSWVMAFNSELESFEAYAEAMPNNCVFLVDTYDTLEGVKNAIKVGEKLRKQGYEMVGIRLDSGDLAYLSDKSRQLLDSHGFQEVKILASNDLDELLVDDLKKQNAKIVVWGVGTKLATAYDQPALGGVYKLSAIKRNGADWEHTIKLSELKSKINLPGRLQVRRFWDDNGFKADMIYDELFGVPSENVVVDPDDYTRRKHIADVRDHADLLIPVFRKGKKEFRHESLEAIRDRVQNQLKSLHPGIRRFVNPHSYPAGLSRQLFEHREKLILKARGHE